MSTVGTTTFVEDGNRNYFTLQNEQYLRRLNSRFVGWWSTMKIGVLFSVDAVADFSGGLWIGLVSSQNYPGNVGYKNPTNQISKSIGSGTAIFGNPTYGTSYDVMTYRNTDISGSSFTAPAVFEYAVSNGTQIGSAGNTGTYYHTSTGAPVRKCVAVTQLSRTSATNINAVGTVISNYTSSAGTNVNHTDITLCDAILNPNPTINGIGMTVNTPGTNLNAVDETNYPMDTINVYAKGPATFRIYQIIVSLT